MSDDDRGKLLIDRSQETDDPVRITVVHGQERQELVCELGMIVAASRNEDGSVRTFQVLIGDMEHAEKAIASALHIGKELNALAEVIAVELASDYEGTAAALGRALVMHARWKERQRGKAQGGPRPHPPGEDGPRERGP